MSLGPSVRRMLGPLAAPVGSSYRSLFLDIGALGGAIGAIPFGPRVLGVGVGEGMVAAEILSQRPEATVLGIDLSPNVGRLFEGDRSRIDFRTISTRS